MPTQQLQIDSRFEILPPADYWILSSELGF
jgi:hypothetical protein